MSAAKTRRWKRWLRYAGLAAVVFVVAVTVGVQTGLVERGMRRAVLAQIERITGGTAELRAFHFRFRDLRAELEGLTIHGREPEGTPPLFYAERIVVDVRIVSFFGRKIALDEVLLDRSAVHIRLEADGRSNYPGPRTAARPGKPFRERIFELTIGQLRLNDGALLLNNTRVPLVVEGGGFAFALDYHAPAQGPPQFTGDFRWEKMRLVVRRYLPFPSDVHAKFMLTRDTFELTELRWKLPRSEFKVSAALASFAEPRWTFRYQGWLALDDLRTILRKPNMPRGNVEFLGAGQYAEKKVVVDGRYVAREVMLPYKWFHASGIGSRGSYRIEDGRVMVPDFRATALGGTTEGRVMLDLSTLKWRAETRARGMDLGNLLRAVDHEGFPVATFHWGGTVDVDDVTAWTGDFKRVESRGRMLWSPPMEPRAGEIPATARLDYTYHMDRRAFELRHSEIATPSSRVSFHGQLGMGGSSLDADIEIQDLLPWDDFINRLRGRDAEPKRITGRARWQGRVTGPLDGPTFAGRVRAQQAAYDRFYWDQIEGDLTYSPREFRLERARAARRNSSAQLSLWLELDKWSFHPESRWSFEAELIRADTDELQGLFGTAYPARGTLTGQFRGRGTRHDPEFTGLFDLAEAQAQGFAFDRFRGQLAMSREEVRLSNAEVRLAGGRVTGNFLYRAASGEINFDAAGAAISLQRLAPLQAARLSILGDLTFQLRGEGPLRAPRSQGSLRVSDLRVGRDVFGSLEANLRSDGRRLQADLVSAMADGKLEGKLGLTLAGDYPLEGDLTLQGIDIDPFIESALRLQAVTGHSTVDGNFRLRGALRQPETITVDADLSSIKVDYQSVKLENDGPVQFTYRREEVRIRQAHIRGPETDFVISGTAGLARGRPLDLNLAGTVNLRLLTGFFPDLDARGAAQVNVAVSGALGSLRINGRARVENVAANYGEFPAGLSRVTGEFVFDSSRLLFENVSAEAGGGQMRLSGSLTYGDGPARYDLTTRATRVRVRYPEGMSWLAGGTLRLSGTPRGGVLSGRVVVERLLMSEGFDLATLIATSREGVRAPTTTSDYLRNLQFDIEASSTPDARVEWPSARFDAEAGLRVRGTWEHPIMLGHIRLLSGEMSFRGNRYRLTRGDINFANPLRLDPVLNVEATTTIRQYEITLNFMGEASRLRLSYRSDPPLPASDIVALLALGRTGEESELRAGPTPVQSPELGATTLLSEAISSQIGGRVERLFGISRFKVDPFLAGTGSEQNASARITIEQQIARDLTITYITNVTSTQQQVIQVEYAVNRDISLLFLRDQNGTFGIDIKFKKRFK